MSEQFEALLGNEQISKIEERFQKKQWHELGIQLLEYLKSEDSKENKWIVYEKYRIEAGFLHKHIHSEIVVTMSSYLSTPDEKIQFLEATLPSFKGSSIEEMMIQLEIAFNKICKPDFDGASGILKQIEKNITSNTELRLRSKLHQQQCYYYKARAEFDDYYHHALMYLSTSKSDKSDKCLAYDLCLAALASQNVCSFAELASHPILNSLIKTDVAWLRDLIILLSNGDQDCISKFQSTYCPIIEKHEIFSKFKANIERKVKLAVFLQMIFTRGFDRRVFQFSEISQCCQIDPEHVEFLILAALSSGLIKGEIDEVSQQLYITWCKPKVLDKQRLLHLKDEILRWCRIVSEQKDTLNQKAEPFSN